MSDSGRISILDGGTSAGFGQWIGMQRQRGKSDKEILFYVMKFWLDFAWSKIPKGDRQKVKANLMQIVTKYSVIGKRRRRRRSAAESEYLGTLAHRIVQALNYKNARSLKGAARFRLDAQFVRARMFAVKHHAAGLYPGYRMVRKSAQDSSGPRYSRHPSGSANVNMRETLAEIMVENFASAAAVPGRPAPKGVAGLAGGAFEDAMSEVDALFTEFVRKDSIKQGMAAGFTVVSFA